MVSMYSRIVAEKVGQGTYGSVPMMQASFAPRKIVKRRVGAAERWVARSRMRVKSGLRRVDV